MNRMADKKERIEFEGYNDDNGNYYNFYLDLDPDFYLDSVIFNRDKKKFCLLEGKELQRAFNDVRNRLSCQDYYHIILKELENYRNDRKIIVRFHQCFIGDEENYKDYCTENPDTPLQYIEMAHEMLIRAFSSFESHVTQSVFCQEIDFSHMTLNHPMYFFDAKFKQEVRFYRTEFQQKVRFHQTEFQKIDADFSNVFL